MAGKEDEAKLYRAEARAKDLKKQHKRFEMSLIKDHFDSPRISEYKENLKIYGAQDMAEIDPEMHQAMTKSEANIKARNHLTAQNIMDIEKKHGPQSFSTLTSLENRYDEMSAPSKAKPTKAGGMRALVDAKRWELAGEPVKSLGIDKRGVFSDVKVFPPYAFKTSDPLAYDPTVSRLAKTDLERQVKNSEFLNRLGVKTTPSSLIRTSKGETLIQPQIQTLQDAVERGDISEEHAGRKLRWLEDDLRSKSMDIPDLKPDNVEYSRRSDKIKPFDVGLLGSVKSGAAPEFLPGEGGLSDEITESRPIETELSEKHKAASKVAEGKRIKSSSKAKKAALQALKRAGAKGLKMLPAIGPALGAAAALHSGDVSAALPVESLSVDPEEMRMMEEADQLRRDRENKEALREFQQRGGNFDAIDALLRGD